MIVVGSLRRRCNPWKHGSWEYEPKGIKRLTDATMKEKENEKEKSKKTFEKEKCRKIKSCLLGGWQTAHGNKIAAFMLRSMIGLLTLSSCNRYNRISVLPA
jgi:hypothetical protein